MRRPTCCHHSRSDLSVRTGESIRQQPRGRRGLTIVAALALVLAAVFVIQTSDGVYELTTDDPKMVAMLGERGGIVVEDRQAGKSYTLKRGANKQLSNSDYDLTVTTSEGLELDISKFKIKRWGKVIASVRIRAGATGEGLRSPVIFENTGGSKQPPVAPPRVVDIQPDNT